MRAIIILKVIMAFAGTTYASDIMTTTPLLDAPGKDYREMTGEEANSSVITVKEAITFQSARARIEELERENTLLKQQLEELRLEYNKKLKLFRSLDFSIPQKRPSSNTN